MARYTPNKRCDRLDKHDEHDWLQDKVFRRHCLGRTTTKLPARTRREGHPRSPKRTN